MYHYAYIAAAIFWLAVWTALFVLWRPQRRCMLLVGLILSPTGPISEYWFLADYWHPQFVVEWTIGPLQFGIEDWLATFALAGICAGVFERCATRIGLEPLERITPAALLRIAGWNTLGLALMFTFGSWLKWGPMSALLAAIAGVSSLMLVRHGRIAALAVLLAAATGLAYWVFYAVLFVTVFPGVFEEVWNPDAFWGVRWLGVPVEEFLWVAGAMLYAGPLLRVCLIRVRPGPCPANVCP